MKITIEEFIAEFEPCEEDTEWARANCKTMAEVWDTAKPEWLLWIATRPGVLPDRELRLFTCWCVRQVWHILTDERSRNAVVVAERFANGEATQEELAVARAAAWDAEAVVAARAAAWDAAEAAQAARLREIGNPFAVEITSK